MKNIFETILENNPMFDNTKLSSTQDGYVEYVNQQIEIAKPIYSIYDICRALDYGITHVKVSENEVGTEVYTKLVTDKVFEYLNNITQ